MEVREVLEELLLLEGMPGEREWGVGGWGNVGRRLGDFFLGGKRRENRKGEEAFLFCCCDVPMKR